MIVTLELSEEEVHALRPLADAAGVEIGTVLHHLIAQILPPAAAFAPPAPKEEAEEKEEEAERRREQTEMQANIRRWHTEKEAS